MPMMKLSYLRPTPLWFYPAGLMLASGIIGALLAVWSVLPVLLLAFAVGWLNGAYLASTRKTIAALFENLPSKRQL